MLAGRDLEASGTWLGVSRSGRFAAVTNFSDPNDNAPLSRGALVADFLAGNASSEAYAEAIEGHQYRGFNLLLWDGETLSYASNKAAGATLGPGTYGLANAALDDPWPKVVDGKAALARVRSQAAPDALVTLLADDREAADERLPKRGKPLDMERSLSPLFIRGEAYGTRASTAVVMAPTHIQFCEQRYGSGGIAEERTEFTVTRESE